MRVVLTRRLPLAVVVVAIVSVTALLVFARPALWIAVLVGAGAGAAAYFLLRPAEAGRRYRRAAGPPTRASRSGGALAVASIVVLVAAILIAGVLLSGGARDEGGGGTSGSGGNGVVRGVRTVNYHGDFTLDVNRRLWRGREVITVQPNFLAQYAATPRVGRRLARRPARALGPGWTYEGDRDSGALAYVRVRTESVAIRGFPRVLSHNRIDIPEVDSWLLRVTLVPADKSTVALRTPVFAIYDESPEAKRRHTHSEDRLTFTLNGLADDPSSRQVEMDVANGWGRNSVFGHARDFTGWTVVKWLLGLVLAIATAVATYLVLRVVKGRWPEKKAPDAPAAAA